MEGKALHEVMNEALWQPLGLTDTYFPFMKVIILLEIICILVLLRFQFPSIFLHIFSIILTSSSHLPLSEPLLCILLASFTCAISSQALSKSRLFICLLNAMGLGARHSSTAESHTPLIILSEAPLIAPNPPALITLNARHTRTHRP